MEDVQKLIQPKPRFPKIYIVAGISCGVVVAILAVVLILISKNSIKTRDSFEPKENNKFSTKENTVQPKCPPIFTHEFTDFTNINDFQPIGSISGASRGRSYITVKKGESVPVYAPMDATLTAVIYAFRGPNTDHGEYGFKFDTKCGMTFLLDHLDSASDEMRKYSPAKPSESTATNDSLSIPVKAGTLLGYTDGTSQAGTFDFLVIDRSVETSYINPKRWQWEQSLYSACPYDYYDETLRKKYYQKIGIYTDTGLIKAESCGHPSYDIANTISGGWFADDSATDLNGEFLLIGERLGAVDLTVKTDSEGSKLRITDYSPKKMPRDIGIGETFCYTGFNNDWVYLHLIDALTIELSNGTGACPATFPFSSAKKYYR